MRFGQTQEPSGSEKTASLRGLDYLNFLMADVRDGVGPYLAVFLKGSHHWDAGAIGWVMAASSIAATIFQVPAGLLVDATRAKRLLIAIAALLIGLGCLLMVWFPQFWLIMAIQTMIGMASTVVAPAIASLSLLLVSRTCLNARISRNESFNHGGNFVAALLAGVLGQFVGAQWIFYLIAIFAIGSLLTLRGLSTEKRQPENEEASTVTQASETPTLPVGELLRCPKLQIFIGSVVLFHFANAAMLPLAGQAMTQGHARWGTMALSACIIVAQLVMAFVAWAVGRFSDSGVGRKPIFLIALLVLPLRGLLFATIANPYAIVAIQLLDGVAAGIFGVVSLLILADLTEGTGRFNLGQGITGLAVGIGASLSNLSAGYIVNAFGYQAGFLYLSAIALLALLLFGLFMPETLPGKKSMQNAPIPVNSI